MSAEKTKSFSTSEGRANFAQALVKTDREKTVVGFARYKRTVAALVPIDAVHMLAGRDSEIDPSVRAHIARMARLFLAGTPQAKKGARKSVSKPAAKKAPAKRGKGRPKAKSAKAKKAQASAVRVPKAKKSKLARRKTLGKSV